MLLLLFNAKAQDVPEITLSVDINAKENVLFPIQNYLVKSYQRIGIKVQVVEHSVARGIALARQGKVDAFVIKTDHVFELVNQMMPVPGALLEGEFLLYCQPNVLCDHSIFNDPNVTIGYVRGFNISNVLLKDKKATSYLITKGVQAREMLLHKRIDYLLDFELKGKNIFTIPLPDGVQRLQVQNVQGFHVINKKHKHIIPQLSKSIEQTILELGPIEESIKRYVETTKLN